MESCEQQDSRIAPLFRNLLPRDAGGLGYDSLAGVAMKTVPS